MTTPDETSYSSLKDSGVFMLMGEINDDSCRECVSWLFEMNLTQGKKHMHKTLHIVVNSPGGDLSCGFAIIDAMEGSAIPVHTIGMGQICSAAFMIFLQGKHRVLTPNTSIMSHTFSWAPSGNFHDLISSRVEVDNSHRRMLEHYQKTTKLPLDVISKKLLTKVDVWLTAQEALELNVCDEIKLLNPTITS